MTELKVLGLVESKKETEDENSPVTIKLKEEFKWFLSDEFKRLREGFIAEKYDECKEKTPPPTLKEYDNIDKEFDFNVLKELFWKEFTKIEQKEKIDKLTGYKLVGHVKLKNTLMTNPIATSMKVYGEVVDKLVNKIIKEGTLVEISKGQYYRSTKTSTTVTNNAEAAV